MTDMIPSVKGSEPTPSAPIQPSSQNAVTAEASASANAPKSYSTSTKVSSLEDLKKEAPELYQKMMEGIATSIINKNRRHQQRLEQLWREGRNDAKG